MLAEEKKGLFKLLLVDKAPEWIESQDETTINNYETLTTAFKSKFAPTEIKRWQTAGQIWTRKQNFNESVDNHQRVASKNQNTCAPVRKPTLKDVLIGAHNSEAALEAFGGVNNSQPDHLSAQMEIFVQKLNAQQINTIRSQSPERKVRFEETTTQLNYNRRQPSLTTRNLQERAETHENNHLTNNLFRLDINRIGNNQTTTTEHRHQHPTITRHITTMKTFGTIGMLCYVSLFES